MRITFVSCGRISIPNLVLSQQSSINAFSNCLSHKGVRISFVQEERRDPQCVPMTSSICVVEDVSIHPDILTLECSLICEHPPFLPGYTPILRLSCLSVTIQLSSNNIRYLCVRHLGR